MPPSTLHRIGASCLFFLATSCLDPGDSVDSRSEPEPGFFSKYVETGAPGEPAQPELVVATEVIAELEHPDGGTLVRFVDENPGGEPSIGVVQVGRRPMIEAYPYESPTALELFLFLSEDEPPTRLIENHEVLADDGLAERQPRLDLTFRTHGVGEPNPVDEEDDWGPRCRYGQTATNPGWKKGFEDWAHTTPAAQRDHFAVQPEGRGGGTSFGYFSRYREIFAGVCFDYHHDAPNFLKVEIQILKAGVWHRIEDTRLTIEETDRYLYYNLVHNLCTNHRQLAVTAEPAWEEDGQGAWFYVAGAWDSWGRCDYEEG